MLDENDTERFDYEVDRPVVERRRDPRRRLGRRRRPHRASRTTAPSTGSTPVRRPGSPGTTTVAANWLLSQPEGLVTPAGGLAGRAAAAVAASAARRPRRRSPRSNGSYRVVDLGDETALAARLGPGRGRRRGRALRRPDGDGPAPARRPRRRPWSPTRRPVRSARARSTGTVGHPHPGGPAVRRRGPARGRLRPGPAAHPQEPRLHVRPREVLPGRRPGRRAPSTAPGPRRRGRRRDLPRPGHDERRRPQGRRGALRLGARAWRRGEHRARPPGPVPVHGHALREHRGRRRVGAHRRGAGRASTTASTPGSGAAGRTYAGGSTTHDTWFGGPIGLRVSPIDVAHQRQPAAGARDLRRPEHLRRAARRVLPVDGRVHRRGRAPEPLGHLQQRVQRLRSTPTASWSWTCSPRCS